MTPVRFGSILFGCFQQQRGRTSGHFCSEPVGLPLSTKWSSSLTHCLELKSRLGSTVQKLFCLRIHLLHVESQHGDGSTHTHTHTHTHRTAGSPTGSMSILLEAVLLRSRTRRTWFLWTELDFRSGLRSSSEFDAPPHGLRFLLALTSWLLFFLQTEFLRFRCQVPGYTTAASGVPCQNKFATAYRNRNMFLKISTQ